MYVDAGEDTIVWNCIPDAYPPPTVLDRRLNGDPRGHLISTPLQDLAEVLGCCVLSGDELGWLDYDSIGDDVIGAIFEGDEMGGLFSRLKKIGKGIGKGVGGAVKGVAKAGRSVGRAVGRVPVVGKGLKGVFDLTTNAPLQLAGRVARGQRLDRAALGTLQTQIKAAKDVAPYAQTVLSVVPVVGTGVNAALSTGLALASGRPLTSALMAGVRGALPGGAIAGAAFDVGRAAVEGKPLSSVALAALPVDPKARQAIAMGLNAAGRIARGQRVDAAILKQADAAMNLLPAAQRNALKAGVAVAQGQNLQKIAIRHVRPAAIETLRRTGATRLQGLPALLARGKALPNDAQKGFAAAVGMLAAKPAAPFQVAAIRANLPAAERAGFDAAVSSFVQAKKAAAARPAAKPAASAPVQPAAAAPCKCPPPVVYYVEPGGKVRKAS